VDRFRTGSVVGCPLRGTLMPLFFHGIPDLSTFRTGIRAFFGLIRKCPAVQNE
jgi:hypothetical protein